MEKRVKYIDIAKGIGIILVVIGHSYSSKNIVTQWISSFHMPLFFIISGIMYRYQYSRNNNVEFKVEKKVRTLLVPYIIWGTAFQLFINSLSVLGGRPAKDAFFEMIRSVLTGNAGVMWFFPALFMASAIFLLTLNNKYLNVCVSIVTMCIGLLYPERSGIVLSLLRAMIGCGFIAIGFYGYKILICCKYKILLLAMFIIDIVLVINNGTVAFNIRRFHNPLIFIVTSIIGSYIMLQISKNWESVDNVFVNGLAWYGRRSSIILCLHMFIIEIIRLMDYKINGGLLSKLGIFEGGILLIIVMSILTPVITICEKRVKGLFGY